MSRRLRNILRGMGSVLEIYPSADYSRQNVPEIRRYPQRYGSPQTDAENLYNDWVKVGDALRHAMSSVNAETDKKTEA